MPGKVRLRKTTIKDSFVGCRVTTAEYKKVLKQAQALNTSVSEYVRAVMLQEPLLSRTDKEMVGELRRLGGLVKLLHVESKGAYSARTADMLVNLNDCVTAIRKGAYRSKSKEVGDIKE